MLSLQLLAITITLAGLNLVGLGIDVIRFAVDTEAKPPHWPLGFAPPADWSATAQVSIVAAAVLIMGVCFGVLEYIIAINQARLVQDLIVKLRSDVYNKMQRLSFRFFDANETGSLINRVTGDVQGIRLFLQNVVLQTIVLFLSISVYLAYMLSIHVKLTLACLATVPVMIVVSVLYGRLVKPAFKRNRELVDKAVLTLAENVQGVHVVKGFARQEQEKAKFDADNNAVRDQKNWIFQWQSLFTPGVTLLTQLNLVVLLGYGGYLVLHGDFALGTGLLVFAGLLEQVSNQATNIAQITSSVQESLTAAAHIEVLDAPLEIDTMPGADPQPKLRGDVSFEAVTFGYKSGDAALKDVEFEVKAGQCVAILGPTGAGKSTLLSLIPRFYDPTFGRVRIDGVDIREMDLDALRRSIGLVFQESFLFSNTVAANIAFGHPDASQEAIEKAAKVACAHDFIMALPNGYETIIGENGTDLSGGQRQRLAIARELLAEPAILLMDDPTAAIDPETEHEILQAMDNAMHGRTTFLVAHRLSTLRRADLVLVLDKGRIVQRGTHDELINTKGMYRRAAKLQAADDESIRLLAMHGMEV